MMRSSAEAQIRQSNSQIRPDDLRDTVTAWQSTVARKELIAQRLVMRRDVATYFGEPIAQQGGFGGPLTEAWMASMATDDPWTAAQELAVTVEASSGRRKNMEKRLADIQEGAQLMFPQFMEVYKATGDPTNANAFIYDWATTLELPNPERYLLPDMRQQMQAQMAQQQPPLPEEQEAPLEEQMPPEQPMSPEEEAMMQQMMMQQQAPDGEEMPPPDMMMQPPMQG